MSRKRLGRAQRAATIIPLALLSAAWTASVAGVGGVSAPVLAAESNGGAPGTLADGTSIPDDPIEDPASLSNPGSVEGLEDGNDADIIAASTTNQIPSAALAAYQRAESVINSADKSCKLTWQLIAAIGRVESDHGRTGGNVLDDDGVVKPGIYGIPLNGKKNTQSISDTDGGQYDNDERWDRAVGPMQFIPSTWSVVGVDADGDGQRNPQDVDDAALASAVYLCSGKDDLSTVVGQRASVYRYNNSQDYVDLVLKIMNSYLEGDYTSVPNNSTAAGYIVPGTSTYGGTDSTHTFNPEDTQEEGGTDEGTGGETEGETGGETEGGETEGETGGETEGENGGTEDNPVEKVTKGVKETVEEIDKGVGEVTSNLISGVLGLLTKQEAAQACQAEYPKLTQTVGLLACLLSYGISE